ncbi:nucleoside triphosphate pyrophosphohydrolase family protein [Sphingobacterium sp. 1.A.4]|uniref:nucleoside triphosphate pyrophosphohydrolase family protein n=1 Tax=Sphingobacterium sp. 1.A.4 TaxID=2044603 RepID=UPI000C0BBD97|nr:nucleoside triphosphate pyrophosphohydrolase family protein [Sphingobacterium sp. 1.A.4]
MNYQELVKEFQLASGQPVSDTSRKLTKDEYDFRDNLLREEIRELQYAIVDNNRVEILDALCDIKYVNDGTANMIGEETEPVEDVFWHNSAITKPISELVDSLKELDIYDVAMANAIVGILTSTFGFTLENFKEALNRVHLSNMSKFCHNQAEIDATIQYYKDKGIDVTTTLCEKQTVVYRKEDGKVLKNVNYIPVKLEDLV